MSRVSLEACLHMPLILSLAQQDFLGGNGNHLATSLHLDLLLTVTQAILNRGNRNRPFQRGDLVPPSGL